MKVKTYFAMSVWLSGIPHNHQGNNGSCQKDIIIRSTSQKKVAEIVGSSLSHLRDFSGIHETDQAHHLSVPKKDNVVYYHCEHCRIGFLDKWFEYKPK